jgi:hypothetical protein
MKNNAPTAMKNNAPTAGQRIIQSAREALVFARGEIDHGCEVYVPYEIDGRGDAGGYNPVSKRLLPLFGLSKRTGAR